MSITLTKAIELVGSAASTQTCLTDELREAMRIVAHKAQYSDNDREEINDLKMLVQHCQIHSGYARCGYSKMDHDERRLFDAIESEDVFGLDQE